jgi:D-glycero-alpha-D-manno-heptose 1-phosphate guanylyltransferase
MTTAVVLAGGLGTRLRSAVTDLPKPMAPVNNRPFLAHLLDYWIKQGVDSFVLSVGYRHKAIMDWFGIAYRGVTLHYAIEHEPLGTGGAFALAATHCPKGHPFLLLNGDTFFAVDLGVLQTAALDCRADVCLSLFPTRDRERYMGVARDRDGLIVSLKSAAYDGPHLANGGVYWFSAAMRDRAVGGQGPSSLENDLFPEWLVAGLRIAGVEFEAPFIDIGVPDDYHRAGDVVFQGVS